MATRSSRRTPKPSPLLPKPPSRFRVGVWVSIDPEFHHVSSFGEVTEEDEQGARLYGRVRDYTAETVYVEVRAAADCSYGHFDDPDRPLAYEPGNAGLTADLPRAAVSLVTDPRTLAWLELIADDTPRARAVRAAEADISEDYYRGAQLMLKVGGSAVQLSPDSASVTDWGNRRHADGWMTWPFSTLEEEPEDVDEVEFERWETVYVTVAEEPDLLAGLRLLWELG